MAATASDAPIPEILLLVLDVRLVVQGLDQTPVSSSGIENSNYVSEAKDMALFPRLWYALSVFIHAYDVLGPDQQVAIVGAHARRAGLLAGGMCSHVDWEQARRAVVRFALEEGSLPGVPLLSAALACALCHVNRARQARGELQARVLVLDGSATEADFSMQGSAMNSCGFAAQSGGVLIDCLSLGSETSVLLRQVASITGGKHKHLAALKMIAGHELKLEEVLSPTLLFHFLPGPHVRKELTVAPDIENHAACCDCHGEQKELAHVCSVCLAVLCSAAAAVCPACGTRFPRYHSSDHQLSEDPELEADAGSG